MRPKVVIPIVSALIVALLLAWLFRPQPTRKGAPVTLPAPKAEAAQAGEGQPGHTETSVARRADTPGTARINGAPVATNLLRPENSATYQLWKTPITFYGVAIDANSKPVAGAEVRFGWTDTSPTGYSQTNSRTDTNGLFLLSGVTGRYLEVSVSKPGYYTSKATDSYFDYGSGYQPDPANPVLFHLRRHGPGADLLTSAYGVFRELEFSTPPDGTPVHVDLLNRKVGDAGQLEVRTVKPPRWERVKDPQWSLHLSIPGGGFIENQDEFPFQAPESGYQQTVDLHFSAAETNWTERLRKEYYVAFGEPRRYGRITIETGPYMGMHLGFAINPTGSRDLEPKESQPQVPAVPTWAPPGARIVPPGQNQ